MGVMDTKVETARWKQGINSTYLVLAWSIFFAMLFAIYILFCTGLSSIGQVFQVAMRLVNTAIVFGLFVGGGGALCIFCFYRHPATDPVREKEEEDDIMPLQRGEVYTRGAKIRNGAWAETIVHGRKKAAEMGRIFGLKNQA